MSTTYEDINNVVNSYAEVEYAACLENVKLWIVGSFVGKTKIEFCLLTPEIVQEQYTKEMHEDCVKESAFQAIRHMSGLRSSWSGRFSVRNMTEQIKTYHYFEIYQDMVFLLTHVDMKEYILKKVGQNGE